MKLMRVILVTGASRGLGMSIAKLFLKNGDLVYVNYFHTIEKEVRQAYQEYSRVRFVSCDISIEIQVKEMMDKIKKEEGKIDILINNAGIARDSDLKDKTVLEFKEVLDVNLIGPFLTCKYVRELMNKGSIINISSTNGIDTYYSYSLDYDASKAGLINLTHNFAALYAPNIRVNTVAPGWIHTDMNKNLGEDYEKRECQNILLGRFAEAEEIANVVFFLASDKASYITSSVIRVDGGVR